jgi:hypothetical protein
VRLDKNITLMDCPGIGESVCCVLDAFCHADELRAVFASGNSDDIALRNCVRVEQLVDVVAPGGGRVVSLHVRH